MRLHLIFITLLIFNLPAWAIKVIPITAELDLTKQRSHTITVINPDKKAVPVKIKVFQWALDENGEDIRNPTRDLRVFPRQFILKAGQKRQVRVLLRNRRQASVEKTYRVLVSELPVELETSEKSSGLFVLFQYATALYVLPRQPQSKVQLRSVKRQKTGLVFTLHNAGNTHTHLQNLTLNLGQVQLTEDDLAGFYNENLLAGGTRRFVVENSALSSRRALRGTLTFTCEHCGKNRQMTLPFSLGNK
jgi:fimbrial chaperone protein